MKLSWKTLPLTDPLVAAHLNSSDSVMIDQKSRYRNSRHHLRLHKDKIGWYVRVGRGASKEYLGVCKVTFFDGHADLFAFTFASHDAFEAEQSRRFLEKHGIAA